MQLTELTTLATWITSHIDAEYKFSKELKKFIKKIEKENKKHPFVRSELLYRGGSAARKGQIASFTEYHSTAKNYNHCTDGEVREYAIMGICVSDFFSYALTTIDEAYEAEFLKNFKHAIRMAEEDGEYIGFRI